MGKRSRQKNKNISSRLKSRNKKIRKQNKVPISKFWNKNKTLQENFQQIGIMLQINKEIDKDLQKTFYKKQKDQQIEIEEEINLNNSGNKVIDQLEPVTKFSNKQQKLSLDEQLICKEMIQIYGENAKKFFRDLKMNKFQWSKKQIKKKLELYKQNYQ